MSKGCDHDQQILPHYCAFVRIGVVPNPSISRLTQREPPSSRYLACCVGVSFIVAILVAGSALGLRPAPSRLPPFTSRLQFLLL